MSLPAFDFENYNPKDPWAFPPERLTRFAFEAMEMLRPARSRWAVERPYPDVRFCVFHEIFGELHALGVTSLMYKQHVLDAEWWAAQPEIGRTLPMETLRGNHITMRDFLLTGLLHAVMRHVEHCLRQVTSTLDPEGNVRENIGKSGLWREILTRTGLKDREPVLQLLQVLHDSCGTGGKFCPPNRRNLKINYRGKEYVFENEMHVEGFNFGFIDTWDWLLFLLSELKGLLEGIFRTPFVAAVPIIKARYL